MDKQEQRQTDLKEIEKLLTNNNNFIMIAAALTSFPPDFFENMKEHEKQKVKDSIISFVSDDRE